MNRQPATKTVMYTYRYTGLSRDKLDLVFDLIEEKAKSLRYWIGSVDTDLPSSKKKFAKKAVIMGGASINTCKN